MLCVMSSLCCCGCDHHPWKQVRWPWGWKNHYGGSQEVEEEHCQVGTEMPDTGSSPSQTLPGAPFSMRH